MATPKSIVRQSICLPAELAHQIQTLAKSKRLSSSRMLLELVEEGLTSQKRKQQEFFALAERFRSTTDEKEAQQLEDVRPHGFRWLMPKIVIWGDFPS